MKLLLISLLLFVSCVNHNHKYDYDDKPLTIHVDSLDRTGGGLSYHGRTLILPMRVDKEKLLKSGDSVTLEVNYIFYEIKGL